jgi:hypothetical protein
MVEVLDFRVTVFEKYEGNYSSSLPDAGPSDFCCNHRGTL